MPYKRSLWTWALIIAFGMATGAAVGLALFDHPSKVWIVELPKVSAAEVEDRMQQGDTELYRLSQYCYEVGSPEARVFGAEIPSACEPLLPSLRRVDHPERSTAANVGNSAVNGVIAGLIALALAHWVVSKVEQHIEEQTDDFWKAVSWIPTRRRAEFLGGDAASCIPERYRRLYFEQDPAPPSGAR